MTELRSWRLAAVLASVASVAIVALLPRPGLAEVRVVEQLGIFNLRASPRCPDGSRGDSEHIETTSLIDFSEERAVAATESCGSFTASGIWSTSVREDEISMSYDISTRADDCGDSWSTLVAYVTFRIDQPTSIVMSAQGGWTITGENASDFMSARLFSDDSLHPGWNLDDDTEFHNHIEILDPGEYVFGIEGQSIRSGWILPDTTCLPQIGTSAATGWATLQFPGGGVVPLGDGSIGMLKARY